MNSGSMPIEILTSRFPQTRDAIQTTANFMSRGLFCLTPPLLGRCMLWTLWILCLISDGRLQRRTERLNGADFFEMGTNRGQTNRELIKSNGRGAEIEKMYRTGADMFIFFYFFFFWFPAEASDLVPPPQQKVTTGSKHS
jgi:hypothetical protein